MFNNPVAKWEVAKIEALKKDQKDKNAMRPRKVQIKRLLQKNIFYLAYYKLFNYYMFYQSKGALGLFFYHLFTDGFRLGTGNSFMENEKHIDANIQKQQREYEARKRDSDR